MPHSRLALSLARVVDFPASGEKHPFPVLTDRRRHIQDQSTKEGTMRHIIITAIAALSLIALAPAAAAHTSGPARRPATRAERARIATVEQIPGRCEATYVSTIDRTWALATLTNSCGDAYQPGGYSVLHYSNRRWHIVTEGDEPGCGTPEHRSGQPAIPRRIWVGLEALHCS
jgi:hypothetical protein